jgi:hypothetical protein
MNVEELGMSHLNKVVACTFHSREGCHNDVLGRQDWMISQYGLNLPLGQSVG